LIQPLVLKKREGFNKDREEEKTKDGKENESKFEEKKGKWRIK